MRLAIAAWEKGASWRAQGWAGKNGDRATGPCTHRRLRNATIHLHVKFCLSEWACLDLVELQLR